MGPEEDDQKESGREEEVKETQGREEQGKDRWRTGQVGACVGQAGTLWSEHQSDLEQTCKPFRSQGLSHKPACSPLSWTAVGPGTSGCRVGTLVSAPPRQEVGWALGGSQPGGGKSSWGQGSCGGGGDGGTAKRERHREVFLGWTGEKEEMETRFLWGQRPLPYFHGVRLESESQAVQSPPRTRTPSLSTYLLSPF